MPTTVTCPSCSRELRVPENLLGQMVKCPACSQTFSAAVAEARPAPPPPREPPPEPPVVRRESRRRYHDEDDDYQDDDYDEPRRRRRRGRRGEYLAPDRGVVILVLGICALVTGLGIILGPMAWIMGNNDLKEIRAGRMDPAGEGNTNAGRICGMIATILSAIGVCFGCAWLMFIMSLVGAGAGKL